MSENTQNHFGADLSPETRSTRSSSLSLSQRSGDSASSGDLPVSHFGTASTSSARPSRLGATFTSSFNRGTSSTATSASSSSSSLNNRTSTTSSTMNRTRGGNAIASVLRKTENPNRAQFTPSTYPGATNLSIASQRAGFDSVAARNPGYQPTTQDRLQVQSRNVSDAQYRRFAQYIEDQSGIVLGDNKHYLVNSRLSSLLLRFKVSTIDELINRAMQPQMYKDISSAVIDAMTTNETLWFRDTYPYLALKNMILPELAKAGKNPVRIWSAACSSGQEPYSIAMVVQEQASTMVHVNPDQCQIIGTDISPEMLDRCRFAHYDNHALARGLSAERKAKFFKPTKDPNVMRVDDKIKNMVSFKQMNLLGSYSLLGKFDIIFCRNVLIYFSNEVKSQILNKFALCLNPGGYLILGSSESIQGLSDKYEMIRCNPGLAYRLK